MTNEFKGRKGVDRIVHAARYSWQGLCTAYATEAAFRQETWLAAVMLPAALWLGRDWLQTLVLSGAVVLVLIVELLNSAIETVVDRVSFERHDLSGRAKDYGSAAVLLALLLCGATWAAALWQRWTQG